MTTDSLDTDRIEAAARALLDGKVAAVRTLAHARQAREDARAALADAERVDAAAYAAALRAGWTTDELKRVGLDAPTKHATGRPRTSRAARTSTTKDAGRSAAATPSTAPDSSSADSPTG